MAVAMLAVAGVAWAEDNRGAGCEPPPLPDTPEVISTNPLTDATGVDRGANIKARSSKAMKAKRPRQ